MTMKFFSILLCSEHSATHILLIGNMGQTTQNDFVNELVLLLASTQHPLSCVDGNVAHVKHANTQFNSHEKHRTGGERRKHDVN